MSVQPVLSSAKSNAHDLGLVINQNSQTILVTLGVAVLERIRCDPTRLQYKLLVGRLVNAGWPLAQLHEYFPHDPRTMKRWASALTSDDDAFVIRALSGRGAEAKLTTPIRRYVAERYGELRGARRDFRQVIVQEVRAYFGEQLSRETLRKLFREIDREEAAARAMEDEQRREKEASDCPCGAPVSAQPEAVTDNQSPMSATPPPMRLPAAGSSPTGLHHAGMVLFVLLLELFCRKRPTAKGWQTQWIGQVLQGAVNVEQSRLVSAEDLAWFTGSVTASHEAQRQALAEQATPEAILDIYRANARLLPDGPGRGRVFYYDPHSKEYTGELKLLKDWCGSRHGIAKVLHLDMLHTRSGGCCFAQHYSPYYDLRERFFMTLDQFDQLVEPEHRSNRLFVLDRGIYGLDTFARFLARGEHILTWEKTYRHDGWRDEEPIHRFSRTRTRNHADDLRLYHFECQESSWARDPRLRRLIVRATNPKQRSIEVSVLCSCPAIDREEAIWLIFNRWLQENGFKYLDHHFGLNQLTSYASRSVAEERDQLTDQPVLSPEYRELKTERSSRELQLGKLLTKRERAVDSLTGLSLERTKLMKKTQRCLVLLHARLDVVQGHGGTSPRSDVMADARDLGRQLDALLKRHGQVNTAHTRAEAAVAELKTSIAELDQRLDSALRHQSRLQLLIDENYRLLDTRAKAHFDALRIVAAGMFGLLVDDFRPLYRNYRHDHVMLRELTRASGFIHRQADTVHVQLWLKGTHQAWQRRAIHRFLALHSERLSDAFSPTGPRILISLLERSPNL